MAPLLTYKDFSRADIEHLAQALHRPPALSDREYSARLAELPTHLRSPLLPCIAPGCRLHRTLNLALLDALVATFLHDITHVVPTLWTPLQQRGALTWPQTHLLLAVQALPTSFRCGACWLAFLAARPDAVVALGALVVGRVNPAVWERSRRVLWLEEVLRSRGWEAEVRAMWEMGLGLREVRKGAEGGEGRGYVGEFVRRASEGGVVVDGGGGREITASNVNRRSGTSHQGERDSQQHERRSPPSPAPPHPNSTAARAPAPDSAAAEPARIASSIYSRTASTHSSQHATSTTSSWPHTSPPTTPRTHRSPHASSTGTQIIDLYRHSAFPTHTAFDARSSTDSRQRSPIYPLGRETSPRRPPRSPPEGLAELPKSAARVPLSQRRAESKGRNVIPLVGHPHVNSRGIRTEREWEGLREALPSVHEGY